MGWTKARELVKVARREGQRFESAEQWGMLYFKVYKSQLPVIEQALETAALMLGSDKSRGYCQGGDLRGLLGRSALARRRSATGLG